MKPTKEIFKIFRPLWYEEGQLIPLISLTFPSTRATVKFFAKAITYAVIFALAILVTIIKLVGFIVSTQYGYPYNWWSFP